MKIDIHEREFEPFKRVIKQEGGWNPRIKENLTHSLEANKKEKPLKLTLMKE